eukprot:jgi/Tetstr1/435754/TSEL_024648.t1
MNGKQVQQRLERTSVKELDAAFTNTGCQWQSSGFWTKVVKGLKSLGRNMKKLFMTIVVSIRSMADKTMKRLQAKHADVEHPEPDMERLKELDVHNDCLGDDADHPQ